MYAAVGAAVLLALASYVVFGHRFDWPISLLLPGIYVGEMVWGAVGYSDSVVTMPVIFVFSYVWYLFVCFTFIKLCRTLRITWTNSRMKHADEPNSDS
jgi:hypothetical protein